MNEISLVQLHNRVQTGNAKTYYSNDKLSFCPYTRISIYIHQLQQEKLGLWVAFRQFILLRLESLLDTIDSI
jgi:hypothetical protein